MVRFSATGRLARAATLAVLTFTLLAGGASAATPRPTTIHLDPTSGPAGLSVAITGEGYAPGTTYGLCILPTGKSKCGFEGANLVGGGPAEQFTAAADGTIPAATRGGIPDLVAGPYTIVSTAPGTGAIVASASFTVTAPAMALAPTSGAAGTNATVTVTGAAPGTKYTICLSAKDSPSCGGVGVILGDFTTDGSGAFPAGTTIKLPGQLPATYQVGLYLANANNTFIAAVAFTETGPSITLSTGSGPAHGDILLSGSGFAPGAGYSLCWVPADAQQCGGVGLILGGFQAGEDGGMGQGNVKAPEQAPGQYRIGVILADSTPWLIASAPFELAAGTPIPITAPPEGSPPATTTAAPAPSTAPAVTESGSGGFALILIVILLVVVLALAFWFARRRREPAKPSS